METEQLAILAEKILEVLGEPFQTLERFVNAATYGLKAYTVDLNSKTALPYMISSLLIAWILYRLDLRSGRIDRTATFRNFLCPREVYLHRSALVDYKYVAFDLSIKLLLYAPLFSGISWVLYKTIRSALVPIGFDVSSMAPFALVFMPGVVGFLLADFGFFFSHYLMHKIPLLWVFHEVHHSAEVLMPVTVHRVHPVEDLDRLLVPDGLVAVGDNPAQILLRHLDVDVIDLIGEDLVEDHPPGGGESGPARGGQGFPLPVQFNQEIGPSPDLDPLVEGDHFLGQGAASRGWRASRAETSYCGRRGADSHGTHARGEYRRHLWH